MPVQLRRPGTPDLEHVAIEVGQIVALGPQHQRRAGDPPPGRAVGVVGRAVETETRPVVLAHGVDRLGVVDGLAAIVPVGDSHPLREAAVPGIGMGGDRALRSGRRLGEEEPVVPALGELGIAARQRLADRHDVEDDQRRHRVGLVQREPHRDVAAPVMPDDGEARVAELPHQGDAVARHRPLRIGLVVVGRQRLRRLPVTAQVGADDGVGSRQERRHQMPRGVRARVSVQQQDRRPGSAVAHAQYGLAHVDLIQSEALEHSLHCLPRRGA